MIDQTQVDAENETLRVIIDDVANGSGSPVTLEMFLVRNRGLPLGELADRAYDLIRQWGNGRMTHLCLRLNLMDILAEHPWRPR